MYVDIGMTSCLFMASWSWNYGTVASIRITAPYLQKVPQQCYQYLHPPQMKIVQNQSYQHCHTLLKIKWSEISTLKTTILSQWEWSKIYNFKTTTPKVKFIWSQSFKTIIPCPQLTMVQNHFFQNQNNLPRWQTSKRITHEVPKGFCEPSWCAML